MIKPILPNAVFSPVAKIITKGWPQQWPFSAERPVILTAASWVRRHSSVSKALNGITTGNFALLTGLLCICLANFVITQNRRPFLASAPSSIVSTIATIAIRSHECLNVNRI
jgi:hypothetical protein